MLGLLALRFRPPPFHFLRGSVGWRVSRPFGAIAKTINAGTVVALIALSILASNRVGAQVPGSFDGSFALGNGKAFISFGTNTGETASAVVVQPDGKILLAGICAPTSSHSYNGNFCLARLLSNGQLDPDFDGPSGNGDGKFTLSMGGTDNMATAVLVQPDGKIVVAGSCNFGSPGGFDFCIARLLPNGDYDPSFTGPASGTSMSGPGRFAFPVGSANDFVSEIVRQPDNKILLVGTCSQAGSADFCLARINPDGTFDTSFNGPSSSGGGRFLLQMTTAWDSANAVAIQPDGKILVAGTCGGSTDDFCIARLLANGTFDSSFGSSGKTIFPVGTSGDNVNAIAVQPDGRIVLAGHCYIGSSFKFCLARLNTDGTLDDTFDGPSGTGNGKFDFPIGQNDYATALALAPDGKIIVAGYCDVVISADFCLARLNPDGSLDTTFDGPNPVPGNGKFPLPIGSTTDIATSMALQPDGKIVVAGFCSNGSNYDFCVARLNGGPFGYQQCSMDIDGDGQHLATRDGLIMTRVMLGLTGSAVTQGITFAPHATRTSWSAIRNFLVTQCGMSLPQ
ncbi:MAG: hypothetical protein RMK02_06710 [Burkholderiales bacterium]|nr:hypothetical protein [Burkholderiales bacterium]